MVVNTVEYIDKIAYSLMKSIGENVRSFVSLQNIYLRVVTSKSR
jgi:hypothetical protein